MNKLYNVFPKRMLEVNDNGGANLFKWIGIGVLGLGLLIAMFVWLGPNLYNDWQVRRDPVSVDATISGKCGTRFLVITDCEAKLLLNLDNEFYVSNRSMVFLDFHPDDYETDTVILRDHPQTLTSSLAVDKIWSRILTMAIGAVIFLSMIFISIKMVFSSLKLRSATQKPVQMLPLIMSVVSVSSNKKMTTYNLATQLEGQKKLKVSNIFKNTEQPFFLDAAKKTILGVLPKGSETPFALDENLQRLNLTNEERQAILQAVQSE